MIRREHVSDQDKRRVFKTGLALWQIRITVQITCGKAVGKASFFFRLLFNLRLSPWKVSATVPFWNEARAVSEIETRGDEKRRAADFSAALRTHKLSSL